MVEDKPEKPPVPVTQCPPRYAEGAIIIQRVKPSQKSKQRDS